MRQVRELCTQQNARVAMRQGTPALSHASHCVSSTPGYILNTVNYGKLNTIWIQLSDCGFWGHDYLTGYVGSSSMFPNQRLGHRLSNCGPVPLGVRTVFTEEKTNNCATVFVFCLPGARRSVVG
jgi:hypothetical protein